MIINNEEKLNEYFNSELNVDSIHIKGIKWQPDNMDIKEMNPLIMFFNENNKNLSKLIFERCELDDLFLKLLAEKMHLNTLTELTIIGSDNIISSQGIIYISNSLNLKHISYLSIQHINLSIDDISSIFQDNHNYINNLHNLKSFCLTCEALTKSKTDLSFKKMNNLKELQLGKIEFSKSQITSIINSLSISILILNLKNSIIRKEGAKILANSSNLVYLTYLNLKNSLIEDEGLTVLCHSKYLNKLKSLNIKANLLQLRTFSIFDNIHIMPLLNKIYIKDDFLDAFNITTLLMFKNRFWKKISIRFENELPYQHDIFNILSLNPKIKSLNSLTFGTLYSTVNIDNKRLFHSLCIKNILILKLFNLNLNDSIVKLIFLSSGGPYLIKLILRMCSITNKSAKYISYSKKMRNLKYLDLTSNRLTSKGLKYLTCSSFLKHLSYLDLSNNDLSLSIYWENIGKSPVINKLKVFKISGTNLNLKNLELLSSLNPENSLNILTIKNNPDLNNNNNKQDIINYLKQISNLLELHISLGDFDYDQIDWLILSLPKTLIVYD